uniref:superoxide dismutase n=1 Tax=Eutreptiella gymnastica TaxID=73025 RepID=A0A7S1JGT3_9EUGL|mmetsp:Transcript_96033/g.165585  ORF Transcript_96033/g.165585 Transcript_96033/m.165585 type:complete len:296 (+) Transcript_96033:71-958(+)
MSLQFPTALAHLPWLPCLPHQASGLTATASGLKAPIAHTTLESLARPLHSTAASLLVRPNASPAIATTTQYLRSGGASTSSAPSSSQTMKPPQPFNGDFSKVVTPLPYAHDGLAKKGMSKEQVTLHYEKHHKGYATKLTQLVAQDPKLKGLSLEELLMTQPLGPVFNSAAQIWNHNFYWHCLSPHGGGAPTGPLLEQIKAQWGSFEKFKEEFSAAATGHFGSGWAWLVKTPQRRLAIVTTKDAEIPSLRGLHPILVCDVWEHAYYVDFRNDRAAFIKCFWDLVHWDFANFNFILG